MDIGTPDRKARYVRGLFFTIADRYDLITRLLSYGQDRRWKARLMALAGVRPGDRALDLACGTGDLAFALARGGAETIGLDITPRMVTLAKAKPIAPAPRWVVGDMMALPIPTASMDLVTTGYGIRNVPVLVDALAEIHRVLRPGGRFLSLDFDRPTSAIKRGIYLGELTVIGSTLGFVLHGDPDTYRYIPASIRRYPGAEAVAGELRRLGFVDVRAIPVFGGFMAIHTARKAVLAAAP